MKAYRTFVLGLFGITCLCVCALKGVKGEDLQAVKWGIVGLVSTVAARSVGHAAANGNGLKGIVDVLSTEKKPQ